MEDAEAVSYTDVVEKKKDTESETEPVSEINSAAEKAPEAVEASLVMESRVDFDLAKTDLEEKEVLALDAEIENYFESFGDHDIEKIKDGKMIINIAAGSSPERIQVPIETSMGTASNNFELSQLRAEIYKNLVLEHLEDRGINNPIVRIDIPVIEGFEPGVSENGERFAAVKAIELTNENIAELANTIIVDRSGSMKDDIAEIEKATQKAETGAKIVDLETEKGKAGETLEMYFSSMQDAVHKAKIGEVIFMIGDEKSDDGRNQFENLEKRQEVNRDRFLDIKKQAQEKRISRGHSMASGHGMTSLSRPTTQV